MTKRNHYLLIPLLLLSFWLGARGLNADSIWYDEYRSIYDAGGAAYGPLNAAEIWERVATRNPWHTPGFFIMLDAWSELVGWVPAALRALALFYGVLAVAWTYRLGRDLVSEPVGIYGAAIMGTSTLFIHYSHEIRMYTLVALLTAFTIWVYLRIVQTPAERRVAPLLWVGLWVGSVSLLYMHYFAALTVMAVGLYHLYLGGERWFKHGAQAQTGTTPMFWRRWWSVVAVMGLAGLLFVPWLSALSAGLAAAAGSDGLHVRALTAVETLDRLALLFSNRSLIVLGVVGAASLVALWQGRRGERQIWYFAAAILALILLVNAALKIMHGARIRYVIVMWAPLSLVAALGIAQIGRLPRIGKLLAPLIALVWLATGVLNSLSFDEGLGSSAREYPFQVIPQQLDPLLQPGDLLVTYLPDGLQSSSYDPARPQYAFYLDDLNADHIIGRPWGDPEDANRRDEEFRYQRGQTENRQRVWLAYMLDRQPSTLDDLQTHLGTTYHQCATVNEARGLRIEQYTLAPVCCLSAQPRSTHVQFDNGIGLVAADVPPLVDSLLTVTVLWSRPADIPPHTHSATLNVFDRDGGRVAQVDYGLDPLALTCQSAQIDLSHLPPGEYDVRAGVYAWETGARAVGVRAVDHASGDLLSVGRVTVGASDGSRGD